MFQNITKLFETEIYFLLKEFFLYLKNDEIFKQ